MTDIRFNPSTNDLEFGSGTFELVDGVEAIAQELRIRLRFFLGEWFLDSRLGIPYFEKILGKKRRQNLIDAIFKKAILTTPGVSSLTRFSQRYEGETRTLFLAFSCVTDTGAVLVFDEPFIIGSPVG